MQRFHLHPSVLKLCLYLSAESTQHTHGRGNDDHTFPAIGFVEFHVYKFYECKSMGDLVLGVVNDWGWVSGIFESGVLWFLDLRLMMQKIRWK